MESMRYGNAIIIGDERTNSYGVTILRVSENENDTFPLSRYHGMASLFGAFCFSG